MSERWKIANEYQLEAFCKQVRQRHADGKAMTVEVIGTSRTTEQNRFLHALCREVSAQKQDETPEQVKRTIKLHFGVPQLRMENESFRDQYDRLIKGAYTYEEKLELMSIIPVTSELSCEAMSNVIDEAIRYYSGNGVDLSKLGSSP